MDTSYRQMNQDLAGRIARDITRVKTLLKEKRIPPDDEEMVALMLLTVDSGVRQMIRTLEGIKQPPLE
jgi:hypothetical protein